MLKRGVSIFRGSKTFVEANRCGHVAVAPRCTPKRLGLVVENSGTTFSRGCSVRYKCVQSRHYFGWFSERLGPMSATKRPIEEVGNVKPHETEEDKRRKLTENKERLMREIHNAGRDQDAEKAVGLFDRALDLGYPLNQKALQTILHLIAGGEEWMDHLYLSKEEYDSPEQKRRRSLSARDADIYKYLKSNSIEMNEFMYTGLARIATLSGNPEGALRIANDCKVKDKGSAKAKPRLRTYTPALLGFCHAGNLEKAMEVESELRRLEIGLTEHEYRAMLSCATRTKNETYGTYILECMLREITKVEEQTAQVLEEYFNMKNEILEDGQDGKYVVTRGLVSAEGVCQESGLQVQRLDLKEGEMKTLAEKIRGLALKREAKGDWAFQNFSQYLQRHGPFDMIIDGANVGFFGQSKKGIFTFAQVEAMVAKVKEMWPDKKPLVILHRKRIQQFTWRNNENEEIVENMKSRKELFSTPAGSNDDWYWIYAAVLSGQKGLIVTNDEMRDHIFQTLESKFFTRWKLCHQVHFTIYDNKVDLVEPGKYTTAIQRSGQNWHFPVTKEKVVRKRHEKKVADCESPHQMEDVERNRKWVTVKYTTG
ncbi:proteinaceous RNase P [Chloropicon primus]|uniref:Mitochondrial ribonuclease P catalytic subunit n=1 Tax=Chloropicon primus TaxID=1764295 RepID=A0A5B8MGD0_9CHLO|nr:proteinaceous RNase P [Chloropicon primus]UPQ98402.1 proteinaceous RNase P [Chloropicon primus]|eukprot:QDZ19194.1 proteinaceous RNase P [Chloropicon primus]